MKFLVTFPQFSFQNPPSISSENQAQIQDGLAPPKSTRTFHIPINHRWLAQQNGKGIKLHPRSSNILHLQPQRARHNIRTREFHRWNRCTNPLQRPLKMSLHERGIDTGNLFLGQIFIARYGVLITSKVVFQRHHAGSQNTSPTLLLLNFNHAKAVWNF